MKIAEDLLSLGRITEEQLRVWTLRCEGHSMIAVRRMMRRRYQTIKRWFDTVDDMVHCEIERHGFPLAGVTIYRPGAGPTDTPLVPDPVLKAIGF